MITDEEIIEIIAKRMDSEVGWSEASKVFNHYGFIDVVTHLFCEKGLRNALLDAYKTDIVNARAKDVSAPYAVDQWIEMNESALGADHPKIVGAKAIRDAMHQWPNRRQAD